MPELAKTGRISNPLAGPSNSSTLFFAMEVQKIGQNFPKRMILNCERVLNPGHFGGVNGTLRHVLSVRDQRRLEILHPASSSKDSRRKAQSPGLPWRGSKNAAEQKSYPFTSPDPPDIDGRVVCAVVCFVLDHGMHARDEASYRAIDAPVCFLRFRAFHMPSMPSIRECLLPRKIAHMTSATHQRKKKRGRLFKGPIARSK